ncbi:rCG27753, isoform CRA_a [Rattus norvegicus]|uniref:RCG27753, isoform CRA_a n=1 Tax=Rattus norvegicus TaxID=10116 RepID=A6KBK1_RAT|nr:rCG27753, isoform CRA_a [Rattus norvegicus]EDL97529.1 rCG27753, isoform CRA_a [Rattus norvegicus]
MPWPAGPGDPIVGFVELKVVALPWPVASSCAISCCAQVPRAAHLQRRAAGIAHRPCWLKKRGHEDPRMPSVRTPGHPARGPQDAQLEDPRTPSARTPGRPARGPQDAQREDPRTPSARTPHPYVATLLE